ncbi:fungal-specific transcription factor domain-containing protein [Aspergillus desertorum]
MGRRRDTNTLQQNDGEPPTRKRCRRQRGSWSRSGCLTCKRRRKRCDEAKPSCHTCTRLGLICEGYSSVWAVPLGPAAQIFRHTEPTRHRRPRPSLSPAPSVGSTASSMSIGQTVLVTGHSSVSLSPLQGQDDLTDSESCSSSNTNRLVVQVTSRSPTPSRVISHLSHLDTHYLQYHMERGSKLLANLETDENPLRSLIIPRALSSPLLMNALCALSAIHFSNRAHHSWSAENEGANYYIDTMRGLRTMLAISQGSPVPDEAILTVSLLCKYEIVRGSVKQWAVHLDALQTLISSRGGFNQINQDTAEFLRGLFVYANNLAKLTTRGTLLKPRILGFDIVKSDKLDIYIGYTEEIIKTCAWIADLPRLASDPVALGLEVITIDNILHTWTSTETTYIIPKGITQATLSRLRLVAESFCDAAYIYLHSVLERITLSKVSSQSLPTLNSNREFERLISTSKTTAIKSLLTRLKTHPIDNNCEFSALTFPLFIAGCETNSRENREFVWDMLSIVEVSFGIGNVKRAKEVLGIVWTSCPPADDGIGDGEAGIGEPRERIVKKHWADVLDELGWDLILA